MKQQLPRLRVWFGVLFLFFALTVQAQKVYTVEEVPNVQLSDRNNYVSDPDGVIDAETLRVLNDTLHALRTDHDIDFAVVVLPSIGERDIESFAVDLFRTWGLGNKKTNNGLLLLVVMDQRAMRYEVGYGLEGVVTDAVASSVQRRYMIPLFKKGAYSQGILDGVKAISSVLRTGELPPKAERDTGGEFPLLTVLLIVGVIAILCSLILLFTMLSMLRSVTNGENARLKLRTLEKNYSAFLITSVILCFPVAILLVFFARKEMARIKALTGHCPKCDSDKMTLLSAQSALSYLNHTQRIETQIQSRKYDVYHCANCMYNEVQQSEMLYTPYLVCPACHGRTYRRDKQVTRYMKGMNSYVRVHFRCLACSHEENQDHRDYDGGTLGAFPLGRSRTYGGGSWSGGSSWGGGSSGGSWGGGFSGGGGATGRW